jgi:hypothetical protein
MLRHHHLLDLLVLLVQVIQDYLELLGFPQLLGFLVILLIQLVLRMLPKPILKL